MVRFSTDKLKINWKCWAEPKSIISLCSLVHASSFGYMFAIIFHLFSFSSVSKCGETEASSLFHKGDQILAVNGLLTDTVEEVQTYLRRFSKGEVVMSQSTRMV